MVTLRIKTASHGFSVLVMACCANCGAVLHRRPRCKITQIRAVTLEERSQVSTYKGFSPQIPMSES